MTETNTTKSLTIERIFNAPRERFFQMFTQAEHLAQWYGPKDWTIPTSTLELKEGGSWHYCMQSPTGKEMCGRADFHNINPPETLSYTESMLDAKGEIMQGIPQMHISLNFEDLGNKTKLTNHITFATEAEFKMSVKGGMTKGFEQAYDSLNELLKNSN